MYPDHLQRILLLQENLQHLVEIIPKVGFLLNRIVSSPLDDVLRRFVSNVSTIIPSTSRFFSQEIKYYLFFQMLSLGQLLCCLGLTQSGVSIAFMHTPTHEQTLTLTRTFILYLAHLHAQVNTPTHALIRSQASSLKLSQTFLFFVFFLSLTLSLSLSQLLSHLCWALSLPSFLCHQSCFSWTVSFLLNYRSFLKI